jgi:hypothetical protein
MPGDMSFADEESESIGRCGDVLAPHAALMEEWLVGRWGFAHQGHYNGQAWLPPRQAIPMHIRLMPYSRGAASAYLLHNLQFDMAYGLEMLCYEEAAALT